jgi:filamentous hemagglutinin family protein
MLKYLIAATAIALVPTVTAAQTIDGAIVPDTTLPQDSLVDVVSEGAAEINGGTEVGNNLFHSFTEFGIPSEAIATFMNDSNIENIITRVTGGNISTIDGALETLNTANLFLINPNGIILGENASLDLGGSFTASSADAIKFEDGSVFSAVNPDSILTVSTPRGVQLGANPAPIEVRGVGHQFFFDDFFAADRLNNEANISSSQSIYLIGGDIILEGANLAAPDGRIEIGAASSGTVGIATDGSLDYSEITQFKDIVALDNTGIDVSGSGSGTISLVGANIEVGRGSGILAINEGDGISGGIKIDASESLLVWGESETQFFPTYISSDVGYGGVEAGGAIAIHSPNLTIKDGAQIAASTFGEGKGGEINVSSDNLEIISLGSETSSAFIAEASWTGDGGVININAKNLSIENGGQLSATTYDRGRGGTINIDAEEVVFRGVEKFDEDSIFPTNIIADSVAVGDGGKIEINSNDLVVRDGAQINTSGFAEGNAGIIKITSQNITLENTSESLFKQTGIFSTSDNRVEDPSQLGLGSGGTIEINADTLELFGGALIASNSYSPRQAGNIDINADSINLKSQFDNQGSLISSLAQDAGPGGDVTINARQIQLADGSQINAGTIGNGDSGNVEINAETLNISGFEEVGSSAILSFATIGSGNGGNIALNVSDISLSDRATISVSNFSTRNPDIVPGTGRAGSMRVQTENLTLDTGSSLDASTNSGGGGNIAIDSSNSTRLSNDGAISAETRGTGTGGEIALTTPQLNLISGGTITSDASDRGDAGNINLDVDNFDGNNGSVVAESLVSGGGDIAITSQNITIDNGSAIATSVRDSFGGGGNITIDNQNTILALNNSDIRANAFSGPGGNINITSELLFTDPSSQIDASSKFGLDGTVEINITQADKDLSYSVLPENIISPENLIVAACPISDENSFAYIGNGGIPNNYASISNPWVDTRVILDARSSEAQPVSEIKPIQEASKMIVSMAGEIELIASAPRSINQRYSCRS